MKNFVIVVPRDQIEIFCQAVSDSLPGSTCQAVPLGLQKYSVIVYYPEWCNPQLFVNLGTRFNELLKTEAQGA